MGARISEFFPKILRGSENWKPLWCSLVQIFSLCAEREFSVGFSLNFEFRVNKKNSL